MARSSGHRNGEGHASGCAALHCGGGRCIHTVSHLCHSQQASGPPRVDAGTWLSQIPRSCGHRNREGHASVCASLRRGGGRCIHATSHLCPCQPATTTKGTSGHTTKLTVWNRAHDTGPCLGVHCIALRWWSVRRQHMQQASLEDGSIQRMMSRQCSSGLLKLNQCNPF